MAHFIVFKGVQSRQSVAAITLFIWFLRPAERHPRHNSRAQGTISKYVKTSTLVQCHLSISPFSSLQRKSFKIAQHQQWISHFPLFSQVPTQYYPGTWVANSHWMRRRFSSQRKLGLQDRCDISQLLVLIPCSSKASVCIVYASVVYIVCTDCIYRHIYPL